MLEFPCSISVEAGLSCAYCGRASLGGLCYVGYNRTARGSSVCLALAFLEVYKDGLLQCRMSAGFTENEIKSFRP